LENSLGIPDFCGGSAVALNDLGASLAGSFIFAGYSVNGLTVTCTGLNVTASNLLSYASGTIAQITSASFIFTLNPQVVSTSGTVSGSIKLISTVGTISSSFTGTYTVR
jgi:hypothetical protein